MTWQDENRKRTERRERVISTLTVWIRGITPEECDLIRCRCFHSAVNVESTEICASSLALAVDAVVGVCGRAVVTYSDAAGFEIKPGDVEAIREREFRRGFRQGAKIARAVLEIAARDALQPSIVEEDSAWRASRTSTYLEDRTPVKARHRRSARIP